MQAVPRQLQYQLLTLSGLSQKEIFLFAFHLHKEKDKQSSNIKAFKSSRTQPPFLNKFILVHFEL